MDQSPVSGDFAGRHSPVLKVNTTTQTLRLTKEGIVLRLVYLTGIKPGGMV